MTKLLLAAIVVLCSGCSTMRMDRASCGVEAHRAVSSNALESALLPVGLYKGDKMVPLIEACMARKGHRAD